MMRVEGVFPGQGLIVGVSPIAAAARYRVLIQETIGGSGAGETAEAKGREVLVPVIAPAGGAVKVLRELLFLAEADGDSSKGEVIDRTAFELAGISMVRSGVYALFDCPAHRAG